MSQQKVVLGDCLDVFANEKNVPAFVSDPPANIAFMGRSWDRAHPVDDYVLPCVPRSKAHERELRSEESFIRYWATRYAMGYDIADQHAVNIVWTLPRTSYQTATALRRSGWTIKDNLVHLFGTGWAKTGNALAPGQEGWLLATKGKPDLDIGACRVPRGSESTARPNNGTSFGLMNDDSWKAKPMVCGGNPLGSLPKNALLSHCEECVRVGNKSVKASTGTTPGNFLGIMNDDGWKPKKVPIVRHGLSADGTESVPAWHCLAGCVCGARSKWDPECSLPTCPCGETWRWLCPVAEVNGQGKERGVHSPGHATNGEHCPSVGTTNPLVYSGKGGNPSPRFADGGSSASRFFNTFSYLSKCSPSERHVGCENLYWKADKKDPFGFVQVTREEWEMLPDIAKTPRVDGKSEAPSLAITGSTGNDQRAHGNVHPTVKSYRLMHWLHSLTGAKRILDFTAGSGTGMYTAFLDGIDWLGAEICPQAIVIAEARLAFWKGLSFDARDSFMHDDIVPQSNGASVLQQSLF